MLPDTLIPASLMPADTAATLPGLATFTALLLAHVLADFVFQGSRMARAKQARDPLALLAHIAVVLLMAVIILAPTTPEALLALLLLGFAHLLIDLLKSLLPARLGPFLLDQALHLASLAAIAALWPTLFANGAWATAGQWLPACMALAAGMIVATRAGGFAVGLLMQPWAGTDLPRGLTNGGFLIGLLERGLIFLFVLIGQPEAIGFLIAAKSVLRFDTAKTDQRAGEYVIIGTLASFGWALLAAYAALALFSMLPHLGNPLPNP